MTWKYGKHQTGRTVRSFFPRRNEGILVLQKRRKSSHEEAEKVIYSLGKQNRWMMPEMVKESCSFGDDFGDEDFVLVDRRSKTKREISIYESSCGNIWGSVCKASTAQTKASEADLVFEVSSPDHRGGWPFERVKSPQSNRKNKRSPKSRHTHVYMEKDWEPDRVQDYFCIYDDEFDTDRDGDDDDDGFINNYSVSLSNYMPEFLLNNNKLPSSSKKARKSSSSNNKELLFQKTKLIVVDDEELAKKHKRMSEFTRKRDMLLERILYDVHDCRWCWDYCYDNKKKRQKRQKLMRKKLSFMSEEVEINVDPQEQQEPEEYQGLQASFTSEFCEANLIKNCVKASELKRVWGMQYNEGGSIPRKFTINLSDSNLLACKTGLELVHVLFELKDNGNMTSNKIPACIKLMIDSELIPIEILKLIITDFCHLITARASPRVVSVEDVISKAQSCIEKHMSNTSMEVAIPYKQAAPCEVLEGIIGWKGDVYMEKEAIAEIKKDLNTKLKKYEDPQSNFNLCHAADCGICFNSFTDPQDFTTLTSCKHSFCNECWKTYINTKLSSGQVDFLCPEHCCKIEVDPVTIMALAPSWCGRYFSWKVKRTMAASKSWKNCPSEKCNLVMRVLSCEKHSTKPIPVGLPVSCACKSIWCYSCQEQAHWPSPCENASKFRAANTGSFQPFSRITSVEVKKCPHCSYPIEKYYGCDHMYCVICSTLFCWYCLMSIDDENLYVHSCYDNIKETRTMAVELPLLLSDAQRVANVAVRSSLIVKAGISFKKEQRIMSMKQGMEAYLSLTNISNVFKASRLGVVLDNITTFSPTDVLRKAYAFELQAHIVIEGMGICLIYDDKTFLEQFMILSYIIEKLAEILNTPSSLFKSENIARLNKLIEHGMKCLQRIKIKKH